MLRVLVDYIQERFAVQATIPLVIILFGAPACLVPLGGASVLLLGGLSTFLALLILRIVDDISDIAVDSKTHPERGLVSGHISRQTLKYSAFFCGCLLLVFNISWLAFSMVSTGILFYAAFYWLKNTIPYVLHPFFVNCIFLIIPIYATALSGKSVDRTSFLLALFTWIGVVGHDFAHSVHKPEECPAGVQSFSKSLGSRESAMLASVFYMLSALFGVLFWRMSSVGFAFPLLLAGTSIHVAYLCINLLYNPARVEARKMYIPGFLFFLLPQAGIIFDHVLNIL